MVANQMNSRRGNQRGEPGEEIYRPKGKMVGAVGEGTLEAVQDAAIGEPAEPRERQRWATAISAQ